jgi:hypothetical protein
MKPSIIDSHLLDMAMLKEQYRKAGTLRELLGVVGKIRQYATRHRQEMERYEHLMRPWTYVFPKDIPQ